MIVEACRTPIGRYAGGLKDVRPDDLGALVCFVGENVRYITSVFQGNWKVAAFVLVPMLKRFARTVPA